jgi:cytochrome c oxidase cbb3-type subunit 3
VRLVALLLALSAVSAAESAETLFRLHCSPCHGPRGDGGRGANLAVPKLARAADDAALSSIITLGIPGTEMPGTRMTADENAALVAYVRALGRNLAAATPGDPARGERLFWSKASCGQCHAIGARGGRLGPDLTDIGIKRGAAHLRQSITDPEASVPDNFAVYRRLILIPDNYLEVRLTTLAGEQITGVRINEDTFSIQIRDNADRVRSFLKSELKQVEKQWGRSAMPSYKDQLSAGELDDIVAFLSALRVQQ